MSSQNSIGDKAATSQSLTRILSLWVVKWADVQLAAAASQHVALEA